MNHQETKKNWSLKKNRKEEALKYCSRKEFRTKKRTVYIKCSFEELNEYFPNDPDIRNHRIKTDFGIADYYDFYKKNSDNPVSKKKYNEVLKNYLRDLHNTVCKEGNDISLPEETGDIIIRKYKRELEILEDGSIVNKFPPNWKATNKLWKEDPEAKKKKILIRHTNDHSNGYFFLILYKRKNARFKGKNFYKMKINRTMQRSLSEPIMKKKFDVLLGNPYKK